MERMCRACSRRIARRLLASLRKSIAANAALIAKQRNAQIDGFRRAVVATVDVSREGLIAAKGRWA